MADPSDSPSMRPIPDGGLHQSMPEWLKRTPAWRKNLDAAGDVGKPVASDTLMIDPRSLVDIDDLPAWLRAITDRPQHQDDIVAPLLVNEELDEMAKHEVKLETPPAADRTVKFEPTTHDFDAPETEVTDTFGGGKPVQKGLPTPLLLGGALLLALLVVLLFLYL